MESGEQASKEIVSGPSVSPQNSLNLATITPEKQRENKRTRKAAALTPDEKESKQQRQLDIEDSEVDPDAEPETVVPVIKQAPTMSDLKDKPNGLKPYRAYQEYAASREQAKLEKCAIYEYTIDKLNDKTAEFTISTPSYKETLLVIMLEHKMQEEIAEVISNCIDLLVKQSYENGDDIGVDITADYCRLVKDKVHERALMILNEGEPRYKDQAPSKASTDITISQIVASISDEVHTLVTKLIDDNSAIFYDSKSELDAAANKFKHNIIRSIRPYKADAREVSRKAVEAVYKANNNSANYPTKGQLMAHAISEYKGREDKAREDFNREQSVVNLKDHTATLTSAVAEICSKEDDRKLRLRNLESVFQTPLVATGDKHAMRASREQREAELTQWVKTIIGKEQGFRPSFTVFVIEAKSANQKTTGILTLALESDKYRMEKLIKLNRGDDRSKPSSQRYSGPDHAALNVKPFKDISNDILVKYTQKLNHDISNLNESEKSRLRDKWSADPDKTSLFITRKTSKNPFRVFFEFVDPSNNVTFMKYIPNSNPFAGFDFKQDIPNPANRDKAQTDEAYKYRYKRQAKK